MSRAGAPQSPQLVTFRYLKEFACLGAACADNCCQAGWRIDVDEGHYRKLRRALGAADFERVLARNGDGQRTPRRFALLVLDERGQCALLDDERLCSLQQRHGEALLPDTCALYPRVYATVGDRLEQTAFLSCPETARLALLDDDAMELDLVPAPPGLRLDGREVVPRHPADAYAQHFDAVRGAALALLSSPRYPVASRVLFVSALARNLAPFYFRGSTSFSADRFAEEMQAIATPALQEALHAQLSGAHRGVALAAELVLQVLASRLEAPCPPLFRRLAAAALGDCRAGDGDEDGGRLLLLPPRDGDPAAVVKVRITPASLLAMHARRRADLPRPLAQRLERYFENQARNYWFREWYLHARDPFVHAHDLAVRIAVLRFLLLGHPSLPAAIAAIAAIAGGASDAPHAAAEARRLLDEAAVEVFYSFARAIEHQSDFMDRVMATLDQESLLSLGHTMGLLRF